MGHTWQLFVDDASNSRGFGAGVVIISPSGTLHTLTLNFRASNNEAEYEALIASLKMAGGLEIQDLVIYSDSQLVVLQIIGEYETRDDRMTKYVVSATELLRGFQNTRIVQIGQEKNAHADSLTSLASACAEGGPRTISVEELDLPSIELGPVTLVNVTFYRPSWIDETIQYLRDNILPSDRREAHRIMHKSARFWLSPEGELYRRSFDGPYLKVVHLDQVRELLRELHEGSCGMHTRGRSLLPIERSLKGTGGQP